MIGPLDNQIIFRKAFTNKVVFEAFVRDILEIEIEVNTIETGSKLDYDTVYFDLGLDVFAESTDQQKFTVLHVLEIRSSFERSLDKFLTWINQQQKNNDIELYAIVLLAAPFKMNFREAIRDGQRLEHICPKELSRKIFESCGYQTVILNPYYPSKNTSKKMQNWLNLFVQSIQGEPDISILNTENEGIRKVIELVNFDNFTPTDRMHLKNKTASKIVLAKEVEWVNRDYAKRMMRRGVDDEIILSATELHPTTLKWLHKEIEEEQ